MEITDIRVRKLNTGTSMKAVASITFENEFVIHDIKILEVRDGALILAMPSRKTPNGEFRDICHPIRQEVRDRLQEAILAAYEAALLEGEE